MLAANLFDHPGLLLIIAAVTLLRWLASKAKSGVRLRHRPPYQASRLLAAVRRKPRKSGGFVVSSRRSVSRLDLRHQKLHRAGAQCSQRSFRACPR